MASAVSPPLAGNFWMESRHAPFGMSPLLFMVFPGFLQGGYCLVPLAGGVVLAEDGIYSRPVFEGASYPVLGVELGGRRGVGGVDLGSVARRVVLGRAVDLHASPSLRSEIERSLHEL